MSTQGQDRAAELALEPMRPASPASPFWTGAPRDVREIARHRELLGMLVQRELKSRYKDSSLGFFWTLARPLALLLIYYIVLGQFLGAARMVPSFGIFIFTGLTAWMFFNEIVQAGTGSVVNNAGLVKKIYLPREVFPLSVLGSAAVNFAVMLAILLTATLIQGQFPTGPRWWYLVLSLAVILVFGIAFAMLLSAVNVYLRDIQYLVEIVLLIAFWASPIVYPWRMAQPILAERGLEALYLSNPITLAVLGFQKALWTANDNPPPDYETMLFPDNLGTMLGVALAVGVVFLLLSQRVFARLQGSFAQEL